MRIGILSRRSSLYSTRRLIEAAEARGHLVTIADPLGCHLLVESGPPRVFHGATNLADNDVVIPRIGASITDYGLSVVHQLESLSMPVVNSSNAIRQARDKLRCLQVLAAAGLPVPRTLLTRSPANVTRLLDAVGGTPVILKVMRGTHGVGVMLAETPESVESILETLWGMGQNVLIQEFVHESRGRDLRLLVVGQEVVGAMRRRAKGHDFRANIHRGGAGTFTRPTPQARNLALDAVAALGLDVAGVDLIETSRGPMILEVNASPGFEEIEKRTSGDIAGAVIDLAESAASRLRAVG